VASTAAFGIMHYVSFASDFGMRTVTIDREVIFQALRYSAAILGILGTHEMGHYLACRYYEVDATLPFFLPFPSIAGTAGAVIKIREALPTRNALFDMGVAGPIAGFLAIVPVLFWGMSLSNVLRVPPHMDGFTLGEPLLFKLATWAVFGTVPDGYSVNMHPIAFAAWFGMLATAFNLLPFGQFDGGHLIYAAIGDRSRYFTLATFVASIAMCFVSRNWVVITILMLAMLYFVGLRHPRVVSEQEPLAPGRYAVAFLALVIFVICFMPVPFAAIK
jgi:membrane-associated protease RseP (regulator of RpoE activity)